MIQKIEKILHYYKEDITTNFSNTEIFNIFHKNKRILLFLINEQILLIDSYFITKVLNDKYKAMKYPDYFSKEISQFISNNQYKRDLNLEDRRYLDQILKKLPDNYEENRKNGENDDFICKLIQKDLIEEFIIYVNKKMIQLKSYIKASIFETNPYLLNKREPHYGANQDKFYDIKKISLIEYAAFFGSSQIFKYLYKNSVDLTPSLWNYSIHGNNPEIIHILEEKKIQPEGNSYIKCLIESIKCHHNDITAYIENNYLLDNQSEKEKSLMKIKSLKYYYLKYIDNKDINESYFFYLCRYDYPYFIALLMKTKHIFVNELFRFHYDGSEEKSEDNEGYILKKGNTGIFDIDEFKHYKRTTALITAIEKENFEIIKILLNNESIDANIPRIISTYNSTIINMIDMPLQIAVEIGNSEIVKLLLSANNINPNLRKIKNIDGSRFGEINTALNTAIENGDIEIVKILLASEKVDPNVYAMWEAEKRWTRANAALHRAIQLDKLDMVKVLLESNKVDINLFVIDGHFDNNMYLDQNTWLIQTENIATPLIIAVIRENIEIIKLLLSNKKINLQLMDCNDKTAYDYANENTKIKKLFKKICGNSQSYDISQ